MRKNNTPIGGIVLLMFMVAIATLATSCSKKPTPTPVPAPTISGSYKVTTMQGYNDNGTMYQVKMSDCVVAAVFTFGENNNFASVAPCAAVNAPGGTWTVDGNQMVVKNASNDILLKGTVTISSKSFVLDGKFFDGFLYTFTKQ
jgi:hypothetical protein